MSLQSFNGIVWAKSEVDESEKKPSSLPKTSKIDDDGVSKQQALVADCKVDSELSHSSSDEDETDDWKNEIVLNDQDVWDDSLLIKMYEESQRLVNKALMEKYSKKNSDSNRKPNQKCIDEAGNENENREKDKKVNCQQQRSSNSNEKFEEKSKAKSSSKSKRQSRQWKINDDCRLIYLEDGIEYEAKIIELDVENSICLVRYYGYENEEWRDLKDLKPSSGKEARQSQIETSKQWRESFSAKAENEINSQFSEVNLDDNSCRMIPPPPPLLGQMFPKMSKDNLLDEDDVLASMLMSWYMTGFHTGYYQAQKVFRDKRLVGQTVADPNKPNNSDFCSCKHRQ